MQVSRRAVIATGLGGGALAAAAGWDEAVAARGPFVHGVASGDPLPRQVILWTRVTPSRAAAPGSGVGPRVEVEWEVASDRGFRHVLSRGTTTTTARRDHTVHVDAAGLRPGTTYWYRFHALGATSRVGRTRTAPAPGTSPSVRFGVVSCANYNWGYFTPYRFLVGRDDLDAVLHLGDYIYEYGPGGVIGDFPINPRQAQPHHECLTLEDYRTRHGHYKLEPDLQDLHAVHPMIAVWDDHEIANDTWRTGAENHDPKTEGRWARRATAGRRAWLEWLPVRHTDPDDWYRINRRLQFGRTVDLWMLDERRFRTKPPKSLIFGYGSVDPTAGDPDATMIGDEQQHWLVRGLRRSSSRWKVLGNQVPFFPQVLLASVPGQLLDLLGPELAAKLEEPLLQLYVEDWNGYLEQRQQIVDGMADVDGVVVLTGDVHQSFASEIPRKPNTFLLDRKSVGVEFVTPGVASPSTQSIFNQIIPGIGTLMDKILTTNLALANPWVRYSEGIRTGCMIVDFDRHRAQADWYLAHDSLARRTKVEHAASWQTKAGTNRLTKATTKL